LTSEGRYRVLTFGTDFEVIFLLGKACDPRAAPVVRPAPPELLLSKPCGDRGSLNTNLRGRSNIGEVDVGAILGQSCRQMAWGSVVALFFKSRQNSAMDGKRRTRDEESQGATACDLRFEKKRYSYWLEGEQPRRELMPRLEHNRSGCQGIRAVFAPSAAVRRQTSGTNTS
jgi:hypothetical protein